MKTKLDTLLPNLLKFVQTHEWCRETYASSIKGQRVNTNCRSATKFCLSGSIEAVSKDANDSYYMTRCIMRMVGHYGFTSVIHFNDHPQTTKSMVVYMVKRSIMAFCSG